MAEHGTIGYRSTGLTHAYLKLAMLQHWEGRCAWCTNAIADTSGFELDHVIAQVRFAQTVIDKPELGIDFDVDDLENLAPLCVARRCNQKKNDALRPFSGAVLDILHRSKQLAEKVRATVAHMQQARGLEKAVLQVLSADLNEPRVKDLLSSYGTALVGRLYRLNPEILESMTTVWPMWQENRAILNFPCYDDITVVVDAELDASGRAALHVAKQLEELGVNLGERLVEGAEMIGRDLHNRLDRGDSVTVPRIEGRSLKCTFHRRSILFDMDCDAINRYVVPNDFGGYEDYVVAGRYAVRVKIRLDGTWRTQTSIDGEPSVFTEDELLEEWYDG